MHWTTPIHKACWHFRGRALGFIADVAIWLKLRHIYAAAIACDVWYVEGWREAVRTYHFELEALEGEG